jgi:hypothetical protein
MSCMPFHGQRTRMSREAAIESYISLRLCTADIMRLSFLVEGHLGTPQSA